ncbi:hypothetical protein E1B28_009563 [Marasmius oreades]|uniref:Cytochrome P450 n=1 Tax=Marasmius oreades TaxID=181124 RepID=A0A9P7RVB7_9AGAR|nr:uncharacterized protein E1B28_009563 [Marasmius oreades]KAG7090446.1 hypothetical protein E1B28_009563 [Marasmius oreades]
MTDYLLKMEFVLSNLWNLGSMRSSESWRTHRKILYNAFHPRVMPEYYADLRTGSIFLLRNIISSPENFVDHVSHYTATLALKLAYGYTELETNDNQYHVRLAHDMNDSLQSVVPGSFLVEYVPILRYLPGWFPGTSFKGKAVAWAVSINELKNKPWRRLKQAIDNGTSVPSFSTRNLEKFNVVITSGSEHTGMEEVIKCCAATIYGVGSDTTTSAIFTFILAMTLYIDVQKRAQDEIDRVVGTSRLPDFSDRDSLPFVNAVFSEVLRWNPVTPLGVSHRAREDDEYEGYSIPRNTTVVPNIWAALHDESLYGPNTMDFDPDRFLKHDVGKPLPPDPGNIAFGFGRRICPGRHLAESSLWITMTYLLATFNVAKEVDSQGQEVEPDVRYSEGLGSGPFPYKCRFIPRSSAAVKLVAN